ncbi:unnamed protein product [Angiostrongylus costaricensis]|uniref:Ig-like domain-containing protein n=1 Tax=Angiostrongylus costaricensis TaxID=334426 RepID=A0A0R3PW82_ANGCS|nr:unnamed protein product [Angiostrongylus costaricensis]
MVTVCTYNARPPVFESWIEDLLMQTKKDKARCHRPGQDETTPPIQRRRANFSAAHRVARLDENSTVCNTRWKLTHRSTGLRMLTRKGSRLDPGNS